MVFMHTPVTHGSAVVIVTATGSGTEVGKIAGMLSATAKEETPLTKQMNTLTLWIVAAAGITMIVMFALGLSRGQSWTTLFNTAVALAIAAIPLALPMVVQVVLSLGSVELAKQKAIVKDLPSVETLGFTSAINSDKTGTLTMNQMTAVEVVDPTDRYEITGSGYSLEGQISHPAGKTDSLEPAILPYVVASDATLVDGKVVGDPTEGALLVLAHKAGISIDGTREELPSPGDAPVRSQLQADGHLQRGQGRLRGRRGALLRQGGGAGGDGPCRPAHLPTVRASHGTTASASGPSQHVQRMGEAGLRVMAGAFRDLDPADFDPNSDLLALVNGLEMTSLVGMVDPPREESKAAVSRRPAGSYPGADGDGRRRRHRGGHRQAARDSGRRHAGRRVRRPVGAERLERIDSIGVVGRVAPEHKVLLADTLKKKGDVVAMTGDGVNDAPVHQGGRHRCGDGERTEVAKNAGGMILSDDNFATIVYAVEQGRKLYDNLNKYIRFVLLELVAFVLDLSRRHPARPRRRSTVYARRRSSGSTSWSTLPSAWRSASTWRRPA